MNNNYKIKDILTAVDALLGNDNKKPLKLKEEVEDILVLKNETKSSVKSRSGIPKNTEEIRTFFKTPQIVYVPKLTSISVTLTGGNW